MNKFTLVNGRYEGRLRDGRLLCVLPDVFEMNRGQFPENELYDPEEWLSSVDGESCWIENKKRRLGRPTEHAEPYRRTTIELPVALIEFLKTKPNRTKWVIEAIQEKKERETSSVNKSLQASPS